MSDSRRLEVGTVYRDSFNLLFDNISIHIANTFIAILATILLSITILGLLAVPAVWGGYSHAMIRMSRGEKVYIGDFFRYGFNNFGKLLGASLIFALGVFVATCILIVPGIYLSIRWFFVNQIIVDQNKSVSEAFKESGKLTSGIFWDIFAICILNYILSGFGVVLIILGFIFTCPLCALVIAKAYVVLSGTNKTKIDPKEKLKQEIERRDYTDKQEL